MTVSRLEQVWRPDGEDALWTMIADAGVRLSGLLRAQTPERRAAVREAVAAGVRALPDATAVPMPALVGAGTWRR